MKVTKRSAKRRGIPRERITRRLNPPPKRAANEMVEAATIVKCNQGRDSQRDRQATGWQKHTSGFRQDPGSKDGQKIESSKNAAGERSYRIAK